MKPTFKQLPDVRSFFVTDPPFSHYMSFFCRKVFTQRENYERLIADSEDRLAKVTLYCLLYLHY